MLFVAAASHPKLWRRVAEAVGFPAQDLNPRLISLGLRRALSTGSAQSGEGGIRTPERLSPLVALQATALDRYATSPPWADYLPDLSSVSPNKYLILSLPFPDFKNNSSLNASVLFEKAS